MEKADRLPAYIRAYRRTAVFDEATIPPTLLRRHCTKPGVWALIRIVAGRLRCRIIDTGQESILDARHPGIVRPTQLHEVEPLGPVRFFVEFHRAAAASAD
jgi:tellurite methyltransferase